MKEMIERLKKKDIPEAISLYQKLAKEQIPSMDMDHECVSEKLFVNVCYVYKNEKGEIAGLVAFNCDPNYHLAELEFIGSSEKKKGIATNLIRKVAENINKSEVYEIYAEVSSKDKRAMKFYKSLGFKKHDKESDDTESNDEFELYTVKATPAEIIKNAKKVEK